MFSKLTCLFSGVDLEGDSLTSSDTSGGNSLLHTVVLKLVRQSERDSETRGA